MPDFLELLDATVQRDEGFPNLEGLIVVAVRKKNSSDFAYWHAVLNKTAKQTGYLDGIPQNATAVMLIDETDSETLLRTGKMPEEPALYALDGNVDLLKRFSQRYLARGSWIALQGGQPS